MAAVFLFSAHPVVRPAHLMRAYLTVNIPPLLRVEAPALMVKCHEHHVICDQKWGPFLLYTGTVYRHCAMLGMTVWPRAAGSPITHTPAHFGL